jgi:hypothetical protein
MAANTRREESLFFLTVSTPIVVISAPPAKLAPAEKHMVPPLLRHQFNTFWYFMYLASQNEFPL